MGYVELLSGGWYKLNFDGLVRSNRTAVGFVVQSNTWGLVEAGSFYVTVLLVSKKRDMGIMKGSYIGLGFYPQ